MKLLDSLTQKLKKQKKEPEELFLTLIVDSDHVAGACWHMQDAKTANLTHAVSRKITVDSWEERTKAADEIISALEERSATTNIHKVIFGFPASYLTADGDIDKTIRTELKTFTQELDLTAIGFVPVHQALMYKLKKEDGVPPTAIVIGIYRKNIVIALYKVGVCAGLQMVPNTQNRIAAIELVLKGFVDIEVLPSRILLYGADFKELDDFRVEMINHPWPTRANFLHFPKVVILPPDSVVSGVSQAGSNELTTTSMPSEEKFPVTEPRKTYQEPPHVFIPEKEEQSEDVEADTEEEKIEPESLRDTKSSPLDSNQNFEEENSEDKEESNVRVVTPEEIGFHSNEDIIEIGKPQPQFAKQMPVATREYDSEDEEEFEESPKRNERKNSSATVFSSGITALSAVFFGIVRKIRTMKLQVVPIGIGVFVLLGVMLWLLLAVFPRAAVTITVLPKQIEASSSAIIDSTIKTVDEKTLTIQGEKLEKTVTGEKTIAVTGKKSVGDSAKGTVSIYNKTLDSRTFKKGTVLSTKSLQFTLDDDVQIASASESIGSITFGKGTVAVTAVAIGTQSNISANNEFSFKDISDSIAIARNEQPFTGGTSKEVTVVSRADQDNLITQITPDLITKAKQELFAGVAGTKKLIEETVKTTVSEKTFTEELNQETSELHGKVSMSVSGIAYDEQVLKDVLFEQAKTTVPTGYELLRDATTVTVGKMTVRKNGTIAVTVSLSGKAKPFLNVTELKKMIAGKSLTDSTKILRELTGVSDVVTQFSYALFKQNIPKESNITITIKE